MPEIQALDAHALQVSGAQPDIGVQWEAEHAQQVPALGMLACVIAAMTGAFDNAGEMGEQTVAQYLAAKRASRSRVLPKSALGGRERQPRAQVRQCGGGRRGA